MKFSKPQVPTKRAPSTDATDHRPNALRVIESKNIPSSDESTLLRPQESMEPVTGDISNQGYAHPHDAQRCLIYNLPNELLHLVFSFIPFGGDVKYTENGEPKMAKQVMILRNVSSRFRAVTNHSDFWGWMRVENVEWVDLIPERGHTRTSHTPIERRKFFESLFSDKYLCDQLDKACDEYNFSCLELAQVVSERLNVKRVHYVTLAIDLGDSLDDCLALMPRFRNIRALELFQDPNFSGSIDLNTISTAFPRLSTLQLAIGNQYNGSLHRLATLKSLLLFVLNPHRIRDFIPSASAALTTFTLGVLQRYDEGDPENDDWGQLSTLTNVRTITLYPFTLRINDHIDFNQLTSLTVWINIYSVVRFFADAFPLLRQLRRLDLTVRQGYDTVSEYKRLCVFMVGQLTGPSAVFQELCLTAGLQLEQAPLFVNLSNLSRLQWKVTPDLYWHESCQGIPQYEWFKDHPEFVFDAIFQDFKKPPVVEISVDELHRPQFGRVECAADLLTRI
jgi:hypothetical protein